MKIKEVRALEVKELEHKLDESYKELFNLRFQIGLLDLADFQLDLLAR